MRYQALPMDHALATLQKARAEEPLLERELEVRGFGERLDQQLVDDLVRQLHDVKSKFPARLRAKDPAGRRFEAEACCVIHRALPFDAHMLADYEFWTWLAITQLHELVDWRHGGKSGQASLANFGIGNGSENLLYRMWLCADIGYDQSRADPYELARRGDQDFWRSHVFRQSYGRCRSLVRALIQYQFPDGQGEGPVLAIPEIRELAKRLKRLNANLLFECLDDSAASDLVRLEAERARDSVAARAGG